jgi:UDP-N-acetylglucosamine 3-dehydrogenase
VVNIGIFGAGFAGSQHARGYRNHPEAKVVMVVDVSAERAQKLAGEVGSEWSTGPDQIFQNPTINLVDICLPTPYHRDYAVRAFAAGKHVVIEKPLALTLADADEILAAANASGKFLMVGHVLRFWPEYLAVRQKLLSGELGRPLAASALRLSNLPQWAEWFRDPQKTGGAVLDLMIHDVDMLNWLFGRPEWVSAVGIKEANGGWNHVSAQIHYDSVQAAVEASFLMPRDFPFTAGIRIVCEGGVLEYQFRAGGASFEAGQADSYAQCHAPGKPFQRLEVETADAFESEIAYFVKCVDKGVPPETVTPQAARLAVQTALAVRESLETGQIVSISE